VTHAAALLSMEPPPEIAFDAAALPATTASFYGANKRVRNDLIKGELAVALAYPTYREGLAAIMARG
jgi:hypothetical protein